MVADVYVVVLVELFCEFAMSLSRHEVNLRRLLAKCELMIKSNQKDDERFPKYIKSLEDILNEIKPKVSGENCADYERRIRNLRKLLGLETEEDVIKDQGFSARDELLGLRQRGVAAPASGDLDELIDYHQTAQTKIAEEMLLLTRNLKEQTQLANKIIKRDTEVVGRSAQLSEDNFSSLKVESEKLQEHSRKACKCWMWIILAIVLVVFISKY